MFWSNLKSTGIGPESGPALRFLKGFPLKLLGQLAEFWVKKPCEFHLSGAGAPPVAPVPRPPALGSWSASARAAATSTAASIAAYSSCAGASGRRPHWLTCSDFSSEQVGVITRTFHSGAQ
jgi:hypothetical protein